jgi:hypothetical protein
LVICLQIHDLDAASRKASHAGKRPVITIRIWPRAKKKNPLWRGGTSELQAWIHLLQTMLLQPRLGRLTKAVDHSHIVYPQGCLADSVDAPIREKSTMTLG